MNGSLGDPLRPRSISPLRDELIYTEGPQRSTSPLRPRSVSPPVRPDFNSGRPNMLSAPPLGMRSPPQFPATIRMDSGNPALGVGSWTLHDGVTGKRTEYRQEADALQAFKFASMSGIQCGLRDPSGAEVASTFWRAPPAGNIEGRAGSVTIPVCADASRGLGAMGPQKAMMNLGSPPISSSPRGSFVGAAMANVLPTQLSFQGFPRASSCTVPPAGARNLTPTPMISSPRTTILLSARAA